MKNCSSSSRDLQTLLDAIKLSEVVENRVQLLMELQDLDVNEKPALNSLVESLTTFWEDFTCLDISQCKLNKTILNVAAKYLESDVSGCLVQFLVLGTKASVWCRKHLKMTLMSTEDSPEEEHSSFFFQLVLDLLSYSAASYSALARYVVSINKEMVICLENFISEHFTLIKDVVCEVKILGVEVLKAAQVALDAATRLCKVYCNGVKWETYHEKIEDEYGDHVIHITKCIIENLCELGTVAAKDGGNLVSLLNMSWKGVVSLLQFGKGALASKVNVKGVIVNLISLANDSLGCAAETWSSSVTEKISVAEAKRIFLPVKFYLINAVRIISQYPATALLVYKEIVICVIMILTFRISLSMVDHLSSASEVLVEILEPTSLHLFNSLMNSAQVKVESKFLILEWLFSEGSDMSFEAESIISSNFYSSSVLRSVSSDARRNEKMLSLGRVALFLNLLTCAPELEDDIRLGIARKLGWLLDMLIEEDIYSSILVLQFPTLYVSSQNPEMTYQPMFCALLHSLKTFMVVVSSSLVWGEVESFLIENLFHPHFLCFDIVTELWCFVLRHAEPNMVKDVVDRLCTLLKQTSRESVNSPKSSLQKTARLVCSLATHGPKFISDQVYISIFDDLRSQHEFNVLIALLIEVFPLSSLSEKIRSMAKQRIITQYYDFLESTEDISTAENDSVIYGAPVFALCAALQSLQVSLSDTDTKTLKFLVSMIQKYRTSRDNAVRDNCRSLLGELLGIISNMKHLYSFDEIEQVILELQNLFISKPALSDGPLFVCKPNLANFMGGLAHVDLADSDDSARSSAAWELYHMLLRERHWAFVHLAITAFGYFAAHTCCTQLWRFVPQDAALSFDLESGSEADKDRFMSELKTVLEKEMACPAIHATPELLALLFKEGQMLKESIKNNCKHDPRTTFCETMDIDDDEDEKQPSKKRKFPDGICKGVELLQSGLKIMGDGLSQWQQNQQDSTEVQEMFLTHFSRLEDVVAHIVSLAETA